MQFPQSTEQGDLNMKALFLILTLGTSSYALADFDQREPLKVDFNRMIEDGSSQNHAMKQELHAQGFGNKPSENMKASKERVTDLIDAEIGWGAPPKIVDRRYN